MKSTTLFSRLLLAVAALTLLSVGDAFTVKHTQGTTSVISRPSTGNSLPLVFQETSSASTQLRMASTTPEGDDDNLISNAKSNLLFGGLWVAFISYAFIFSPGEVGAAGDTALIQAFIENPTSPEGFNELFFAAFNLLGVMPLVMAQLIFPQGSKEGLPATPFCLASAAAGYFALGSYLTFRSPAVDYKTRSEMGWVSANVLENKIFAWVVVALTLSCYVSAGVFQADPSAMLESFGAAAAESKFMAVSTADLSVITIASAALIRKDIQLRNPDADDSKATLIAAASLLLPVTGAGLYCALRPALPEE